MSLATDQNALAVFALIKFHSTEKKWSKIGEAKRKPNGVLELKFDCWPTNAEKIEIRPVEIEAMIRPVTRKNGETQLGP